jgi:hypothetical protein
MKHLTTITLSLLLSFAIIGCSRGATESESLKIVWQSSGEALSVPESVVYDEEKRCFYVSNVNSQSSGNPWVNNSGFISVLNQDGSVKVLHWIEGLKAPKGLTLDGSMLYVADLDQVVKIDTIKGKIIERFQAPKGVDRLNDIVYDAKRHLLYLSNSSTKEIYQVDDKGIFLRRYAKESDSKAEQNGLYIDHDNLIMQGSVGYLKALSLDSDNQLKSISNQIHIPIDGITKYKEKGYLVSAWGGEIHFIDKNGKERLLLDSKPNRSADIFYVQSLDLLLVPDFDKHVIAYKIKNI